MNQLIRAPQVGMTQGNWIWDGQRWVCCPDDGTQPPCPPPGFPPLGCPPWFPPPEGQPPWYPGANAGVSFSQTAPPNPTRGHFWWNGTTLAMWDGAVWVTIGGAGGGGGVVPIGPNPPPNPFPGQLWFDGTRMWIWDGTAWIQQTVTHTFIQATAPPAPAPGDTWWDGTQFRIWDGSKWEAVGPGATVGPVPTTTLTFAIAAPIDITGGAAGAWGVVNFTTTPQVDTTSGWDATTKRFTPKKSGQYFFDIRGFAPGGASSEGIALAKNDSGTFGNLQTDIVVAISTIYGGGSSGLLTTTGMTLMNGTTDFVRFFSVSADGSFSGVGANPVFAAWIMP